MARLHRLGTGVAVAAGLVLAVGASSAQEAVLALGPEAPGQQLPAAGQSLFDELFATPAGYDIPFPFERLLEALNARTAPARARTALIPLGRSLQRYAADPGYFASPRLVVAVDADGTNAIDAPLLRDRIFLGYQPAAEAIEVISYNEAAGRFEFQEVMGYGDGLTPQVGYAARDICVPCHQGHGPIFSRPLWSETNGSAAIAARMTGLGASYHGAPVRQGVDEVDDFDQATDRANRIAVINRLWDEGCGEGSAGAACRAALLRAALHYRLVGARAEWQPTGMEKAAAWLQDRVSHLWPGGLATLDPDLPNRDPLLELARAKTPDAILETEGTINPRNPRAPLLQWRHSDDPSATLAAAARGVADMFAASDIAWLDGRLTAQNGPVSRHRAPCRLQRLAPGDGRAELRADCAGADVALAGFVTSAGNEVDGGRIDTLSVGPGGTVRRLRIAEGDIVRDGNAEIFRLVPREDGAALSARLLTGARITNIVIDSDGASQAMVEITVVDDMGALDTAIGRLAGTGALDSGPLRRRTILASLDQALAMR